MTNTANEPWYPKNVHSNDRTSQTDDERIKDITVLPPPEHLIRFFPIQGTAAESLISSTRQTIHNIMVGRTTGSWSLWGHALFTTLFQHLNTLKSCWHSALNMLERLKSSCVFTSKNRVPRWAGRV